MKSKLTTTKIVYYYQHVNERGLVESKARVEVPGLGVTIDEAFRQWKGFMAACGYLGIENYELERVDDDSTR